MLTDAYRWIHTDKAYCDFAFSLCVSREPDDQDQNIQESLPSRPVTRAACSKPDASSSIASQKSAKLAGGGANFVDAGLKVVVKQAAGTLMVFRPAHPHGTTAAEGMSNRAISITFSQRILDAYEVAKKGLKICPGRGAGEGNTG